MIDRFPKPDIQVSCTQPFTDPSQCAHLAVWGESRTTQSGHRPTVAARSPPKGHDMSEESRRPGVSQGTQPLWRPAYESRNR